MIFNLLTCILLVTAVAWGVAGLAGWRPFGSQTEVAVFCLASLWSLNSAASVIWDLATRNEAQPASYFILAIGLSSTAFYAYLALAKFRRTRASRI